MYKGYRVKINEKIVSDNLIAQGSYSSYKKQRVLYDYHDGYGKMHEELSPRVTMHISFDIRERSEQEQRDLSSIWEQFSDILVEYWNDVKAVYETGYFKMERPVFKHRNTRGGRIRYDKTTITLEEY